MRDKSGGQRSDDFSATAAIETALKCPWVDGIGVFYCETAVTKATDIANAVITKSCRPTSSTRATAAACG
ncbi:MAG: hypothetical protein WCI75_06270 [candidate division NC10 bacterium]